MKVKRQRRLKGTGTVFKRGNIWYIKYINRSTGKPTVESSSSTVKSDAEELLRKRVIPNQIIDDKERLEFFKSQIKTRENQLEEIEKEKRKIPIQDILEVYYSRGFSQNLSLKTQDKNETMFKFLYSWCSENLKSKKYISELTRDDIVEFLAHMKKSVMASTYNGRFQLYKSVFKHLGFDLFEGFKCLVEDDVERECFSKEEILKIEEELERRKTWKTKDVWKQLLLLVRLGYMTGQRQEDLVDLTYEEIDFEKGYIHFKPKKTIRFKKEVYLPMFPQLRKILEDYRKENDCGEYLMPVMFERWRKGTLKDCFSKVLKDCGIETMIEVNGKKRMLKSLHSLRHSFVSFCANSNVPLDVVRSVSLHCDEKMIRKYYHLDDSRTLQVMSAMGQVVSGMGLKALPEKETIDVECVYEKKPEASENAVSVRIPKEIYDVVMKDKGISFEENLRNIIDRIC